MARVVEQVLPEFGGAVSWEKVVIKTREGARRFRELGERLGRFPPVPSIVVDGRVVFEMTPSAEDLRRFVAARVKGETTGG